MTAHVLWPRDPMVVRDGRPNQGRSESATLAFPWPGTVAGVVRTRVGSDADGRFTATDLDALRRIAVRGPLLTDGRSLYVPAPRDAVALRDRPTALFRARPLPPRADVLVDGEAPERLVGFAAGALPEGKPAALPAWWRWDDALTWLTDPGSLHRDGLEGRAIRALPLERRVHVKLTADRVAEDAMLFETEGIRFVRDDRAPLGIFLDAEGADARRGLGAFAGERRLVQWEAAGDLALPGLPDVLRAHLGAAGERVRVRVVLLTPAHFTAGSQPSFAGDSPLQSRDGVTVTPVASIVPRPETVSGWDFATNQPKGTRRLVAAGSVWWIELKGPAAARVAWAEGVWMRNVSDGAQDRRDGYGLAALGVG